VTDTHEAIDELLAGYVLRSLSGEDAVEADRLLTEHVPGCATCRDTLDALGAVAADLGLDASALEPPETLLPRIHRELEPRRSRFRASGAWFTGGRIVAVAASVMLVVGLGGLALSRGGDGGPGGVTLHAADLQQVQELAAAPGSERTTIGPITEVEPSGVREFYVVGEHVPQPPFGTVYRLWATTADGYWYLNEFLPSSTGLVAFRVSVDPTTVEDVFVTVEPIGSVPSEPGAPAWEAG
jgi:hypothetical protein